MCLEEVKNIDIRNYTYDLPEDRIAKFPLKDRSASKLLVYDAGKISEEVFSNAGRLLKAGDTLIFNNTRVIYARLFFKKVTGALIEVFCLEPTLPADYSVSFASVGSCTWKCMIGNLKKWKEEKLSCFFYYKGKQIILYAEQIGREERGEKIVRFTWGGEITFGEVLECCGKIPIPPYLDRDSEESDKINYQTVYSKEKGSVASPTAGLHFTTSFLKELKEQGVFIKELTLHVGAGTFKPVKAEKIGEHSMHTEHILISIDLLEHLMNENGAEIVAVGTTSVRTLESIYWMGVKLLEVKEDFSALAQWEAYTLPAHYSRKEAFGALYDRLVASGEEVLKAQTTIVIVPGYHFKIVDCFFTNFHQPLSTLLLLVSAAIGEEWKSVYAYAMENNFRFLSYGDSSFLTIKR